MEKEKYIEDLREIKDIMNRSSRFISLSGLSGVVAGTFALIGSYVAYQSVYIHHGSMGYGKVIINTQSLNYLLMIALGTIILSVGSGIYLTTRETRKRNQKFWDLQTKRLLINLAIPLIAGGIFCLMLLFKGYIGIIPPLTLVFYGLALVNASKYTLSEVRSLGIAEIILGLMATYFIGYGLLFWSIGFGLLHIVYGVVMHIQNRS